MLVSLEILLNVLSRKSFIRSATNDDTLLCPSFNFTLGLYSLDSEPKTPSAIKSNVGREFIPTLDNRGFRSLLIPLLPVNLASLERGVCSPTIDCFSNGSLDED